MIIADENIDHTIIKYLRSIKCEVLSISEESPGISDHEVINLTISNKALLITEDKDFGEIVFAHDIKDCTVLLLRYDSPPDLSFLKQIKRVLDHKKSNPGHTFYTITPKRIRFRTL